MSGVAPASPTPAATGSIYDLGYQRYRGPRLGRRAAVEALFSATVKACFGIGRGGRAKLTPWALVALAILPAVLAVGFAAIAAQVGEGGEAIEAASPIRYSTYHGLTASLIMLFCASQAPELFGRDQRYGVLQLYFSRPIERADYALSRLAGLWSALLVLVVTPFVVLFLGRVLVAPDPLAGLSAELPSFVPGVAQAVLSAVTLGAAAAAIAAFTPRRAYATAAIIGLFIVPPIIANLVDRLAGSDLARFVVLLSPGDLLDGTNAALFDVQAEARAVVTAALPGWAFITAALAWAVVAIAATVRRYDLVTA